MKSVQVLSIQHGGLDVGRATCVTKVHNFLLVCRENNGLMQL